jgi:hypothetical protein
MGGQFTGGQVTGGQVTGGQVTGGQRPEADQGPVLGHPDRAR